MKQLKPAMYYYKRRCYIYQMAVNARVTWDEVNAAQQLN